VEKKLRDKANQREFDALDDQVSNALDYMSTTFAKRFVEKGELKVHLRGMQG